MSRWALLLLLGVGGNALATTPFADDFEDGNLVEYTTLVSGGGTAAAVTGEGKVGSFAVRMADTSASAITTAEVSVPQSGGGNFYARFWSRRGTTGYSAETDDAVILAEVRSGTAGEANNFASFGLVRRTLFHDARFTGRGTVSSASLTTFDSAGSWALLELYLTGIGTATGTRALYFNGNRVLNQTGIGFSGALASFALSVSASTQASYTATFFYDQLRIATAPLASKLVLTAPPQSQRGTGECFPIVAGLIDSVSGAASLAPYRVDVALTGALMGPLHSDPLCAVPQANLPIAAFASSATGYVRPSGVVTIDAAHPDFLGANTGLLLLDTRKLAFTTPARTTLVGGCSQVITLQYQNGSSQPVNGNPTQVNLASSSSGGRFHLAADCSDAPVSSVSVPTSASTASFYYRDSIAGSPKLTASANALANVEQIESVRSPQGASCSADASCLSGFCAGGVCCDRACAGLCEACSVAARADVDGTCKVLGASVTCRPAAGACDQADVCDGLNAGCPADAKVGAGTVCLASAGACDPAERCDGLAGACPADLRLAAGTVCRAATGACDVAEVCGASDPACPADALVGAGAVCRAAAGECDLPEACSGLGPACPGNRFLAENADCSSGYCGAGVCHSNAPRILRDALKVARVGQPYVYNDVRAVRATGRGLYFYPCGASPAGFRVGRPGGDVSWIPERAGTVSVCVAAGNGLSGSPDDLYPFEVEVSEGAVAAPEVKLIATPSEGPATLSVSFDGSQSRFDPPSVGTVFNFSFGNGGGQLGGSPLAAHAYRLPGTRVARLWATGSFGETGEAEASIAVLGPNGERPPRARIVIHETRELQNPALRTQRTFSCDCQEGDAPLVDYRWDLGSERQGGGPQVTGTFMIGARHPIRLVVTDANGLTAHDAVQLALPDESGSPPECWAYVDAPAGEVPFDARLQGGAIGEGIHSVEWKLGERTLSERMTAVVAVTERSEYPVVFSVSDAHGICERLLTVTGLGPRGEGPPRAAVAPALGCGDSSFQLGLSPGFEWSLIQAPAGLSVDPSTGMATWINPSEGIHGFSVSARSNGTSWTLAGMATVTCPDLSFFPGCGCSSGAGSIAWALLLASGLAPRWFAPGARPRSGSRSRR
jgi:hypothetical protein